MYACAVTCGQSFTVSSVWGVLISFWSVLLFSPTLLSLFYYFFHYYYCLCFYFYSLLLLLLFPQSSWLCVRGAWVGARCGGRGLVAGLGVGLACGVLLLPGFWGQQLQPPGSWAHNLHMRLRLLTCINCLSVA